MSAERELMLHAAILLFSHQRFLIWPVFGIVAGILGLARGFSALQRRRLILNTPASKIRSASAGLVEISGLATGPHVITSPLRQAECFFYSAAVYEWSQRGKTGEWVKVADESVDIPFYIDDDTEKLLIDPRGAEMDLHDDFREEYQPLASREEIPARVTEFLARYGVSPVDKAIKVEERCIKPDEFLFALGTLSQNPGLDMSLIPARAARAFQGNGHSAKQPAVEEIIRLSGQAPPVPVTEMSQQQKIAAALARSGSLAIHSWLPRRNSSVKSVENPSAKSVLDGSTAATAVVEKRADPVGFDLHPPVVLMKGSAESTFFISWRSQRDLANSLGWKSTLLLWASPAMVLACIYLLVMHFR